MKKLLLTIDMQNDFIQGSLGTKEAQQILPFVIQALETAAADPDTDILFTLDTHDTHYMETQEGKKLPVPHCIKPEEGWQLHPSLLPFAKDALCLEKPTFGCTALVEAAASYDRITLVGLCTDICVISNALLLKAFYPEKELLVDARCCAGVTPESHDRALNAMKVCQIDILHEAL